MMMKLLREHDAWFTVAWVDFFKLKSAVKSHCFDCQHFDFQKHAKGHVLLELVYQHLELIEKDYFGLQFSDNGMPPTTENSDVMVRKCCKIHCLIFLYKLLK
jgi:hypothetical protein